MISLKHFRLISSLGEGQNENPSNLWYTQTLYNETHYELLTSHAFFYHVSTSFVLFMLDKKKERPLHVNIIINSVESIITRPGNGVKYKNKLILYSRGDVDHIYHSIDTCCIFIHPERMGKNMLCLIRNDLRMR